MTLLASSANRIRLGKSRLRDGTVRFKVGDLSRFYGELDRQGIPHVILRWAEDLPLERQREAGHAKDVDHLVGPGSLERIRDAASAFPGSVSLDFYAAHGERGGSYQGMPYYMPFLADRILARRVRGASGIWVPCAEDALLAFLYHLVYHKGARCGLPTGLGFPAEASPARDYAAEARRLAAVAGIALPEPLTLLACHDLLVARGWGMANDLLPRWPERHRVLEGIRETEVRRSESAIRGLAALTVFIIREDPIGAAGLDLARRLVGERFRILEEVPLAGEPQRRVMERTRGGNWIEKGWDGPNRPTLAFVCRNAPEPGPLPVPMSMEKVRRRYPHISTTDVLIKRRVRTEVARLAGIPTTANVLHATDNAFECLDTLRAVYGEDFPAAIRRLTQI